MTRVVTSKSELKQAFRDKEDEIVVIGDLAEKVSKTTFLMGLSSWKKKSLIAAVGVMGVAGAVGISKSRKGGPDSAQFMVSAFSEGKELDRNLLVIVSAIGVVFLFALYKEYDVEVSREKVVFKRKNNTRY